ncbi:MAG TPA: universal stress protein [Acidimicrobiales bacterium]
MATTPPPTDHLTHPKPLAARPVHARRVVVPVDGSPFAERALPVAAWTADALGVGTYLVQVVPSDGEAEPVIRYLDSTARRHGVTSWDVLRADDVSEAIAGTLTGDEPGLPCLATHGRDRSAAVLGSVAEAVVERVAMPVVLAGPQSRPARADDAPIMAGVDGGDDDGQVVEAALGWAATTGRRLVVATVAEPVPAPYREDRPVRRGHGPPDPEGYVEALVERALGSGVEVVGRVAYDPVSVRDGLVDLAGDTTALVVLGTHHRSRPARTLRGSHAARIVHDLRVPALLVPLDARG